MDLPEDGLSAVTDFRFHHLRRVILRVRLDPFEQTWMFYGVSSDLMAVRRELLPFLHPFSPGFGARGDEECSLKAVLLENRTDVVEMSRHRIIKSEGDDGRAITGPGSHR